MNKIAIFLLAVVALVSVAANILLYFRWSDRRPVVTFASNDAISRIEYEDALDDSTKGAVLKKLLYRKLIMDAAVKAGLTPTPEQTDQRYAQIQRQSPQLLEGNGADPKDVTDNKADIAATLALDNLRFQGIHVSDSEISSYYAIHQDQFMLPAQSLAVLVVTRNPVDTATAERMLRDGARPQDIANTPGLFVSGLNGFVLPIQSLPTSTAHQLENSIYSMPIGAVKTFPLGSNSLSVRVTGKNQQRIPPLSEVRDQVVQAVMNQKAPTAPEEMAKIYQSSNVQFGVQRYAAYFDDIRTFNTTDNTPDSQKTASLP